MTKRKRFASTLVALLLLSPASAQLWENARTTAAQPILSGFSGTGDSLKQGQARIEFDRVGQRVVGVYVTAPKSNTEAVARGILAAWGAPAEAIPNLKNVLDNPGFQTEASKNVFQELDERGQSEVSIRLKNGQWHAYTALKVHPESAFPTASQPLGSKTTSTRIDIVSDYQCPYCKQLWESSSMADWRGKSNIYRLSYHHFPLAMHPNAMPAAAYAECAAEQGKMWDFSDLIFRRFGEWTSLTEPEARAKFAAFALEAGVTGDVAACAVKQEDQVRATAANLQRDLMIQGTPSVYVNGIKVGNYNDPREIREIRAVTEGGGTAGKITEQRLRLLR